MSGLFWLLLGAGFLFASLPFVADKTLFGLPLLKAAKTPLIRIAEFLCLYAAFVLLGRAFEASVTQVASQGWAYYAVTFLLFVVAATPAFIWRYLWKR